MTRGSTDGEFSVNIKQSLHLTSIHINSLSLTDDERWLVPAAVVSSLQLTYLCDSGACMCMCVHVCVLAEECEIG